MVEATNKFYNIKINLIKNGHIYAENVAIRNVWEKESNIFFDIYFHRLNKSFIFDSVFIHDIYDVSRDKFYNDIGKFIKDFYAEITNSKKTPSQKKVQTENNVFSSIENDIIILLFMAQLRSDSSIIKRKIIYNYICQHIDKAKNLSEQYIYNYIASLNPELDNFYKSLKNLKSKSPQEAQYFLREIVKICMSDGYLHYHERMYLAEIIYILRNYGMNIPANLI